MSFGRPTKVVQAIPQNASDKNFILTIQDWFAKHVQLDGKPYTLDFDQARAVCDAHHNTLVTARAGSGKTRVIVAKVAYLVAHKLTSLEQILVFMFNRTAAAEVNQRIAAVKIDGEPLIDPDTEPTVASTFHKFALDLVKSVRPRVSIISEAEQTSIIRQLLRTELERRDLKLPPAEQTKLYSLVVNFLTRAGQKFPGPLGIQTLQKVVDDYVAAHADDSNYSQPIFYHQISAQIYANYLQQLISPLTDFNQLMADATTILSQAAEKLYTSQNFLRLSQLKFIMIDEYQDFSYLFFALIESLRRLATSSKLFAVGDDWQAINRFAGSDVNYFIHFDRFFPKNQINIPLATNYRSCRKIVERANKYMLTKYDPSALPAIAFHRQPGRIGVINPLRTKFDRTDLDEDGLGDGRFMQALLDSAKRLFPRRPLTKRSLIPAAKYLKTIFRICKHHASESILLLHRHNFTSFDGIDLTVFHQALGQLLISEQIMNPKTFETLVRAMTMHKSKGLEAEVVIILEFDRELVAHHHPNATLFELFGDTLAAETADQERLIYVAITRAKRQLFLLTKDKHIVID